MNQLTPTAIKKYEAELRDRGFDIYCGPSDFTAGRCSRSSHPHTTKSRHFQGHAIDAGRDPASGKGISDFERAHLDRLAAEARNRGYRVIWRRGPGDHQDHVHIELGDPTRSVVHLSGVTGIAIAKRAFPLSNTQTITLAGAAPVPAGVKLRLGSSGRAVRILQEGMNRVFPAYSNLTVNGVFRQSTEAVVVEFQIRSGLEPDGVVGKDTRRALAGFGITW